MSETDTEKSDIKNIKEHKARQVVNFAKMAIVYMAESLYMISEFDRIGDFDEFNDLSDLDKAKWIDLAGKKYYEAIDIAKTSKEAPTKGEEGDSVTSES